MSRIFRHLAAAVSLSALAFVATPVHARSGSNPFEAVTPTRVQGSIVDVAVGNPNFSTLVTALTAANLVTTLQGRGPFTVFAPTNAAFAKLPPAVLQYFLSNPGDLTRVLLYHVAGGARDLQYALFPTALKTVLGQEVFATTRYDAATRSFRITVNNSVVTARPLQADNGIVYVIDSVLLPQYR